MQVLQLLMHKYLKVYLIEGLLKENVYYLIKKVMLWHQLILVNLNLGFHLIIYSIFVNFIGMEFIMVDMN